MEPASLSVVEKDGGGTVVKTSVLGLPTYKVVVVGKYGVGKTSLLWRYLHGDFHSAGTRVTIVDVQKKRVTCDDKEVELELWDTAGEEQYSEVSPNYYNNAHAIMVVYDIMDPDSFLEVRQYWINEIFGVYGEEADHQMAILLVGTKYDMVDIYDDHQVIVRKRDVLCLKEKHERLLGPIECSAKTGKNVDIVFETLVREIISRMTAVPSSIQTTYHTSIPERRCC